MPRGLRRQHGMVNFKKGIGARTLWYSRRTRSAWKLTLLLPDSKLDSLRIENVNGMIKWHLFEYKWRGLNVEKLSKCDTVHSAFRFEPQVLKQRVRRTSHYQVKLNL